MSKYTRIENLVLPAIEAFNCHLYGLELLQSRGRTTLRVLLERDQGVITIDDISKVSKQIGAVLEVADAIPGGYVLEVSSPGLDRPLFKNEHYLSAIGQKVSVGMTVPIAERKNFHGVLTAVSEEALTLEEGGIVYVLPRNEVQKARVVPEIMVGRGQKK
ncbi:MAG: ribosome maturation factor RimP [Gammaproteobacteria bacterium]